MENHPVPSKEAFEPLLTSTPAKRKGEAIEHESLDSSRAEEPNWPENSASMEQEEENSSGEDSKDDDTMVRSEDESSTGSSKTQSGQLEGNISTQHFSNFKERTFFFMFEDNFQFRNIVVDLGGKVEEFFDVLKVTDLVVNSRKTVCQPVQFNTYSRGQRAINCSSKYFSLSVSYDTKIVDIAEKNNISVYTKNEFYRLVQSEKRNRNELTELKAQRRKPAKIRELKPPFIKVEDQSRGFCPIFKELDKWPTLDVEEDRESERAERGLQKVDKKTYCEHCEEHVLNSQLEMHCKGERHKSIVQQPGYWKNVDALISKLPSLKELEDQYRKTKLYSEK